MLFLQNLQLAVPNRYHLQMARIPPPCEAVVRLSIICTDRGWCDQTLQSGLGYGVGQSLYSICCPGQGLLGLAPGVTRILWLRTMY